MDNACVSSATLVLLSGDDGRVDAQAEWPGRCTRHGFFRCSKKLRVKSVAGHRARSDSFLSYKRSKRDFEIWETVYS